MADQVDVLIERAQAAGLGVRALEITSEGAVRIVIGPPGGENVNPTEDWVEPAGRQTVHPDAQVALVRARMRAAADVARRKARGR
jgi:ribosomal protein S12 methylthiotransferase accessory factor YcaO